MNKSYNMNIDTGEKTWLTPPHIINALGPFDLDPCCPPTMPWRTATRMVHWPEDGLKVDWTGKRVWCNPPYGRDAMPFLGKMAENMNRDGVAASVTDEKGVRTEAATPGDLRCERNMKRDRVAYVRTDITGCADGIHVKLSVMNPRVVVGNAEPFAREYAVMCARILVYLREAITTARIVLIEGEGARGVYADAEAMNRYDDLAKMRASCDRLHNGNCSPCKFDCPLYMNGKCKDPMKEDV